MRKTLYGFLLLLWIGAGCHDGARTRSAAGHETTTEEQRATEHAVAEVGAAVEGDSSTVDSGMRFTVAPLHKVVPVEGPMQVEITLRNVSDSIVVFKPIFNFGAWLDAEIVDSAGVPVPKTAQIDPPNALRTLLRPGESLTVPVDLRCSTPVNQGPCMAAYDGLFRPGVYQVKMHFTLPCLTCDERVTVVADPFTIRVDRSASRVRR